MNIAQAPGDRHTLNQADKLEAQIYLNWHISFTIINLYY